MNTFTENIVEQATLDWLQELGYTTLNASQIAPDEPNAERQTYSDVILTQRLENALQTINPNIPPSAIEDAIKKLTRIGDRFALHLHMALLNQPGAHPAGAKTLAEQDVLQAHGFEFCGLHGAGLAPCKPVVAKAPAAVISKP